MEANEVAKPAFETCVYEEHRVKAFYLGEGVQNARIEIWKFDAKVHEFFYPAYRIWNIYAHMNETIDDYLSRLPSVPMREVEAGKATAQEFVREIFTEAHAYDTKRGGFDIVDCHDRDKAMSVGYGRTEIEAWRDAAIRQGFEAILPTLTPSAPTLEGAGEDVKLLIPLSKERITPEIRLMASRAVMSHKEDGQFSLTAHLYAAYTIIREQELLTALTERNAALKDNAELKEMFELHRALITRCLCAGIVFQGDDEPLINERAEKLESERNAAVSRAEKAEAVILEILSYLAHTYSDKSHMRLSRCCRGALHGAFDTAMKYQPTLRGEVMPDETPYEIGRGSIELAPGLRIDVITLNTGQAIITEDSMMDFLNWIQQGNTIDAEPKV